MIGTRLRSRKEEDALRVLLFLAIWDWGKLSTADLCRHLGLPMNRGLGYMYVRGLGTLIRRQLVEVTRAGGVVLTERGREGVQLVG